MHVQYSVLNYFPFFCSVQISKEPNSADTNIISLPNTPPVEDKQQGTTLVVTPPTSPPEPSTTIKSSENDLPEQSTVLHDRHTSVTKVLDTSSTTMDPLTPPVAMETTQADLSPSQKTRFKKTLMKVEKTQNNTLSSNSSSCVDNEEPNTTEQDPSMDNEANIQLSRKESDDSIPDCDQGSEESNGSEDRSTEMVQSKSMSFTKEPGTGQTILWKEGVEESDNYNNVGEKPLPPLPKQPSPNNNNVVSYSVSVPLSSSNKTRNKTKKQKAQQKREEKMKKKRKEKEESARRANEAHESFDKESVSSSTNSTDIFEDASNELAPNDNETDKNNQNTKQEEPTESNIIMVEKGSPSDSVDVGEPGHGGADEPNDVSPGTTDDSPGGEEEVIPEMETSYSTIEFKSMSSATPSPDDLSNDKKLPPEEVSPRVTTAAIERSISGEEPVPSSPADVKPSRSSISAPTTPSGKGGDTTVGSSGKPRPSQLDLHVAPPTDDTDTSGESNDKSKTRLDPHELAASLLKSMPRPPKQKHGGNNSNNGSNSGTKASVKERDSTEVSNTKRNNRKNKSSSDNTRDKRTSNNNTNSSLTPEAMPFYPHYPGMPHPRAGMPPHPLPPPLPFPPSRGSIPYHVPNPSYEYPPMMRHMGMYPTPTQRIADTTDQIHQLDRKQRKRSDPPSSKTFSPPTFPEGSYHDSRPYQYPVHEYESPSEEWMGSTPDTSLPHPPPGYLEDDPFTQSYPTGARRTGNYIHNAYNYNPEYSHSMVPRSSTGMEEPDWDLTPEEVMYLKEHRRQKLKKLLMAEKHHQQTVSEGLADDMYKGLPPSRHSSDPYSLASLRDREYEQPPPLPRHRPLESGGQYHVPLDMMDTDSTSSDLLMSLRKEKKSSRDEPSYHWPPAPGSASSGSINRAPGPPGSSAYPGSIGLGLSGQSSLLRTTDTSDTWNEHEVKQYCI